MLKTLTKSAAARQSSRAPGRDSVYRIAGRADEAEPGDVVGSVVGTDIVELIRSACRDGARRALGIANSDARGRIFVDQGHVVHAEFGEDYGLRAVVEILRSGPFSVEPCSGRWPSQSSLHLSVELLVSMVGRGASRDAYRLDTRVIRRVDHAPEAAPRPPPLPEPDELARASGDFWFGEEVARHSSVSELPAPRTTLVRTKAPKAVARSTGEASSMVRVSTRGALLAAHGKDAERLVDAAVFIHGLANAIAIDLGGQGRAGIHLRGRGKSLFVTRSEVGDIAGAMGGTRRLASLLRKLGLR